MMAERQKVKEQMETMSPAKVESEKAPKDMSQIVQELISEQNNLKSKL